MLVFGDVERSEEPRAVRAAIAGILEQAGAMPPGLARHAELARAFVRAAELAQAVADADFAAAGADRSTPAQAAGARFLHALAAALLTSWSSAYRDFVPLPDAALADLALLDHRGPLRTRRAEGYALYALYPEAYFAAARASGLGRDTCVIGIRSIGIGLAALVAAALGAAPAVSLRPVGHPFARTVKIAPDLAANILAPGRTYAIVDEGPGLSGSSFLGVAAWLAARGVDRTRIHFFPSHGGDLGAQASAENRAIWAAASRHCVSIEDAILTPADPSTSLSAWVTGVLGPLDGPLEDFSGGAWRAGLFPDPAHWPACDTQMEKRKFLATAGGLSWLAKFSGLGDEGLRKFRIASRLAEAGFVPPVADLCHGFLLQRWIYARPATNADFRAPRPRERVAAYLGFRARHLPAHAPGASLAELAVMARNNAAEALGADAAAALVYLERDAERLAPLVRPVATDNRCHAWEWLFNADGVLLKADALDHNSAHDLVGCQDIAWDVAGAAHELALGNADTAQLAAGVAAEAGHPVATDLVAFYRPCYLAFQLGLWHFAAMSAGGAEVDRCRAAASSYAQALAEFIAAVPAQSSRIA